MKKEFFSILLLILSLATISAQEYRGGVSAEMDIFPRLEAEGEFELRKIFIPESYFNRTFQLGLNYSITRALEFGIVGSYAAIDEEVGEGEDNDDERSERIKLSLDLQYQPNRFENDLRITNRLRYQYTVLDDEDERKEYLRNKLTLDYRISGRMNPYVAIEPYFMLNRNRIRAARFYIGNELTLFGTELDLYYIAEMRFNYQKTTTQYIVGLTLKFDLEKVVNKQ